MKLVLERTPAKDNARNCKGCYFKPICECGVEEIKLMKCTTYLWTNREKNYVWKRVKNK
jgi:hypothetical protein